MIVAVDGGNSKTDLALVHADGAVLALVRGPQSSPHHLGVDGCLDAIETLLAEAEAKAGVSRPGEVAELLLAGVDFPAEEAELERRAGARGWAARTVVHNDTFAVLRGGTDRGWGVAIVCGAGINCIGVAPDGRHARFPALGAISGDWGGGYDIGLAAVAAAARSEDGRGPSTTLELAVPAFFGLATPGELAEAIHLGRISQRRAVELAPLVLAEAADDPVAAGIVDRLAAEVVALARAALARLSLSGEQVEVILGGGVLRSRDERLLGEIARGLGAIGPGIEAQISASPPIVGAALLGLDELGAGPAAHERLRGELEQAAAAIEFPEALEASSG